MASSERLLKIIIRLQDEFSGQLDKATSGLASLGSTMQSVGNTLTRNITTPLVNMATAGVDASAEFQAAMKNVQSISGQTDAEIAAFSERILDLSTDLSKTTDSAVNLANGLYDVIGSGHSVAESQYVLEQSTMAATAGLTDTATAVRALSAVLNAYGLDAEQSQEINDLLFKTVERGVGTYEQLASSLSNVIGTAQASGVSFAEVSAAMSTASKRGMSFSEASVAMNQAMLAFLKPSTAMRTALSEMGYESGLAAIEALGFGGAVEAVREHVGGSADAMAGLFSNVRALKGALAISGENAIMFAQDLEAMQNSTGATAAAFAIQTQTFEAQMKNFANVWQETLIKVGDAVRPIISAIVSVITPLLQWFNELPQAAQTAIVAILAIVAAIGPLLVILGQLVTAAAAVKAAFAAGGVLASLPGLLASIAGGFGAVVAAVSALLPVLLVAGVAIGAFWALMQDQRVRNIPKVWGDNLKMAGEIIGLLAEKAKNAGANFIKGFIQGVKDMAVKAVQAVINFAKSIHNAVKDVLKIQSPSKVMMELGQMTAEGFNQGLASVGGIGVQAPQLSGAGASVSSASGGSSGGGNFIMNGDIHVPPGTTQEQIKYIMREIAKEAKRKGWTGL